MAVAVPLSKPAAVSCASNRPHLGLCVCPWRGTFDVGVAFATSRSFNLIILRAVNEHYAERYTVVSAWDRFVQLSTEVRIGCMDRGSMLNIG